MDEIAKSFADLATKYGPQVADAALGAARVEAYSCLVGSLGWGLAAAMLCFSGRCMWQAANSPPVDDSGVIKFISGLLFLVGGACALALLWAWIDPWTWVAINHPELWLAKRAFHI